ncbi:YlbE family protein [Natronincola ferrireducens]|uniref:DUF1116 domain-containing protein n=1 Tax=Natronincola ferrireducens TaxID=393762 RepID=A0A1G9G0S0_9FIRM|nr:DUF1116 domain-containing protein [Natronincola ferrireducens]SDK94185.1 Protein of unknown function [Natronincola ferrireducens]
MISIEQANQEALKRINSAEPFLVDVKYAKDVLPGMDKMTIGHAGPPIQWENMCGPLKGAIIGAIRYEGLAATEEEAEALAASGKIKFVSNHSLGAVGPMTGMITYSMPLYEVKNETFGNYGYCTFNEGLGKVMRFGANDDEVIDRLKWLEKSLAPAMKKALELSGPINLKVITAQALAMGDEMHQRNIAASSLFARVIMPYIVKVVEDKDELEKITKFITSNDQFYLNIAMALGKATMDPVKNIEGSTVVTAMSRNGTNFGIKVSGLGDRWFEAPVLMPQGLFFPGYSLDDANPDMGDSTIVETFGIGGFTMGAAPAVVRFVGAASVQAAINYTRDMVEITVGKSPHYQMPNMDFEGAPTAIDIRKVVETGILPVINTGMAHKKPGVGQVGAGIVNAPMDCFTQAIMAFAEMIDEKENSEAVTV